MIRSLAAATFVLALLAGIVLADAKSDYEMLFGDEARKVLATKSTADDAAFAKKLLDAAKAITDAPKTQVFIYEKVVQFGGKDATGAPHALEAIDILIKSQPAQKLKWQEEKLKVTDKQYQMSRGPGRKEAAKEYLDSLIEAAEAKAAAGKAKEAMDLYGKAYGVARYVRSPRLAQIGARLKQVGQQAVAGVNRRRRLKVLAGKLAADPSNVEVRTELIEFCIVELDDPAKAASLLASGVDEKLREYVPLAAKKPADLTETACLELGQWYHKTLLAKASRAGKAVVLARAKIYYERYLSLHTKRDVGRYKASAALAEVNKELAKLGGAAYSPKLPTSKFLTLNLPKGVTMKLIRIPAGSFMMGSEKSEKGRRADEGPQHKVTISKPFYMGVTEVTVGQFGAFVADSGYKTDAEKEGWGYIYKSGWVKLAGASWRKARFTQTADHPVICVSWNDAVAFCRWLGKRSGQNSRLPTEAEWECACRAGTKTRFYFGEDEAQLADHAWYRTNSDMRTHPVARKKPNPAGLYDMYGNVWEWCADFYAKGYDAKAKTVDPTGPTSGTARARRGGPWIDPPGYLRSASRHSSAPDHRNDIVGFRVIVAARATGR